MALNPRQPMGASDTALDGLWPTLQALPGVLRTLPQWWGGDTPTAEPVPEPELEPIEDIEARTGDYNYSMPPPGPSSGSTFVPRAAGIMPWEVGGPRDPRNIAQAAQRQAEVDAQRAEDTTAEAAARAEGARYFLPPNPSLVDRIRGGRPVPPEPAVPVTAPAPAAASAAVTPPPSPFQGMADVRMLDRIPPTPSTLASAAPPAGGMAKSTPIRALRLPNGKLIFTDQGVTEPGATEVSTADAGRDIRARAAQQRLTQQVGAEDAPAADPFAFRQIGPSSSAPPIAQRSTDLELARMRGEAPDYVPGGMEGSFATDETKSRIADEIALENYGRELEKASLAQALKFATMSPQEQASLEDDQMRRTQWAMGQMQEIDDALKLAKNIMDPKERDTAVADLMAQKAMTEQMFFGDGFRSGILNSR